MTNAWLTTEHAARLLGMHPSTVMAWSRAGRLVGSERRDGQWMVRRSEVERVLTEREAAHARRMAKWHPMMQRPQVAEANGRGGAATDGPSARRQPWSAEEDAYLLQTLDDPVAAVAAHLGRSDAGVTNRRWVLRREGRA